MALARTLRILRLSPKGGTVRVVVLGSSANKTNVDLVTAWCELGLDVQLVAPPEAMRHAGPDVTAVARLDVLPTLNGVEPGLVSLVSLAGTGTRIVNRARPLLTCHDKLRTARALDEAGVLHPRTWHVGAEEPLENGLPVVVKPRFGSWGHEVFLCRTDEERTHVLSEIRRRPWFRRHGAVLQELVQPRGEDVRMVVAGGRVVGAARRVSAPGEWRTNVSLGGTIHPLDPSEDACDLAVRAAAATGASFVGVDLLPLDDGGYTVLELNGAVEFMPQYGLYEGDVYADVAEALDLGKEEHDVVLDAHRVAGPV